MSESWLSEIPILQFINLINNFSSKSPIGRIEQLLATKDNELSGSQRQIKNKYIFQRNEAKSKEIDWSKGIYGRF